MHYRKIIQQPTKTEPRAKIAKKGISLGALCGGHTHSSIRLKEQTNVLAKKPKRTCMNRR